jgi:hypothetical protein
LRDLNDSRGTKVSRLFIGSDAAIAVVCLKTVSYVSGVAQGLEKTGH